jgi:sugar lactone lactonase YvrE
LAAIGASRTLANPARQNLWIHSLVLDGTLIAFAGTGASGRLTVIYPDGIKLEPGNFYVGGYSAGNILVVTPDGKLVTKHTVPSAASPNLTFSADGKTLYVMAVDNKNGAPYEGKVYAVKLK